MPSNRRKPNAADWLVRLALLLVLAVPAFAERAATVTQLAGMLTVRKADGTVKILNINSQIDTGDLLSTNLNTYARIKFTDGGDVTLLPNTQFRVDNYQFAQEKPETDSTIFRLLKGGLRAVTGLIGHRNGTQSYQLATPSATIGIRGTRYGVLLCSDDCADFKNNDGGPLQNGMYVDVTQGRIAVNNSAGGLEFAIGQFGYIRDQLTPPILLPPKAGVPISPDTGHNAPPASITADKTNNRDVVCTMQ